MELKLGDCKRILLYVSLLYLVEFGNAGRGKNKGKNHILSTITTPSASRSKEPVCDPCDVRTCAYINAEECDGQIVKDECDCCPVCQTGTMEMMDMAETQNDTILFSQSENQDECQKIKCPKPQKCMLNIQNIPVCRCPSPIWCRGDERKEVCGSNGKTYKNKCFFQVDECGDRKLSIYHKGACLPDGGIPLNNKWGDKKKKRQQRRNRQARNPVSERGEGKNSKKNRKSIRQEKRKEKIRNKKERLVRRKNRQRQSDKRVRF